MYHFHNDCWKLSIASHCGVWPNSNNTKQVPELFTILSLCIQEKLGDNGEQTGCVQEWQVYGTCHKKNCLCWDMDSPIGKRCVYIKFNIRTHLHVANIKISPCMNTYLCDDKTKHMYIFKQYLFKQKVQPSLWIQDSDIVSICIFAYSKSTNIHDIHIKRLAGKVELPLKKINKQTCKRHFSETKSLSISANYKWLEMLGVKSCNVVHPPTQIKGGLSVRSSIKILCIYIYTYVIFIMYCM